MARTTIEVTPGNVIPRKHVIPPALLAHRMERYAVYLIVISFLLMGLNWGAMSGTAVLWFASGLMATFALSCAVAVVILQAIQWNFDRMREELKGGREGTDMR